MTVKDYNADMVLGQKWAIQVEETLCHNDLDEPFEEFNVNTFHYSVPSVVRCLYWNDEVQYFRVVHDEIILVIHRFLSV